MSSLQCCCKTSDCVSIKQNQRLFRELREHMQTFSELGQYLLSECKTYTENAEHREKLFKLEISRLKAKMNETGVSLIFYKKRNKELEEEIYKVNKKNKDIVNHIEDLNALLSLSKSHIQNLSSTLQTTKSELAHIRLFSQHRQTIEKQMTLMKAEKSILEKKLEQSLKIGMFLKKKWTQSEQLITVLETQINGLKNSKEKKKIQNLIKNLNNYKEIETMDIESIKLFPNIEKSYLFSFVKELITKNSLLKKAYTDLYNVFSMTQNEKIQQQILLQPLNNANSLFNNSLNLQHTVHNVLYNISNNEYWFLEKAFIEASLNCELNKNTNKNTNALSKSDTENKQIYLSESNDETGIEIQSFTNPQLFVPTKSEKLYIKNSRITKTLSAPNLLSSGLLQSSYSI
ncbi:hypothetical protein PCK2_000232, partial [Pneumocystis canis]